MVGMEGQHVTDALCALLRTPSPAALETLLSPVAPVLDPIVGSLLTEDRPHRIATGPLSGRALWVGALPFKGARTGEIWLDLLSLTPLVLSPEVFTSSAGPMRG